MKRKPQDLDYRYVWKFIWTPTRFSTGELIWLKRVYVKQVYFTEYKFWVNICLADPETGLPYDRFYAMCEKTNTK